MSGIIFKGKRSEHKSGGECHDRAVQVWIPHGSKPLREKENEIYSQREGRE